MAPATRLRGDLGHPFYSKLTPFYQRNTNCTIRPLPKTDFKTCKGSFKIFDKEYINKTLHLPNIFTSNLNEKNSSHASILLLFAPKDVIKQVLGFPNYLLSTKDKKGCLSFLSFSSYRFAPCSKNFKHF